MKTTLPLPPKKKTTSKPEPDAEAKPVEEVEEVVGVLAGGIEADDKGDGRVVVGEVFEASAELGVAGGGFGEGEFGGGDLVVVVEEGGIVAVA